MSKYRMDDGSVIDTSKSTARWEEETFFDGRNSVSKATGSQWDHETLYRSRKGRYYIESTSQWQGKRDRVEWISRESALAWLLINGHEVPSDLKDLEDDIVE